MTATRSKRRTFGVVVGILAFLAPVPWAWAYSTTVAVLPFAARSGESQAWLSKGLSDLFLRHLAEIPSLSVLERDHMQAFLSEMDLGQAPLFDEKQALRVGRVARVRDVLYGTYELRGPRIRITAFWLDLDRQTILCTEEAS